MFLEIVNEPKNYVKNGSHTLGPIEILVPKILNHDTIKSNTIQIHEWNKLFSKVEILGVFSSVRC